MKITAKVDYACRSVLELAMHWPNPKPLQVNEIARRQRIPLKFLIHILIYLREHGVVNSTRGNKGGYLLARPPAEIRLSDLIKNFEGNGKQNTAIPLKIESGNIMGLVWQEVDGVISNALDSINFEYLCNRVRDSKEAYVYEI